MSEAVVLLILLIRKSGLRPTHAVVSAFLGFYLARSQFAPTTQDLTSTLPNVREGPLLRRRRVGPARIPRRVSVARRGGPHHAAAHYR